MVHLVIQRKFERPVLLGSIITRSHYTMILKLLKCYNHIMISWLRMYVNDFSNSYICEGLLKPSSTQHLSRLWSHKKIPYLYLIMLSYDAMQVILTRPNYWQPSSRPKYAKYQIAFIEAVRKDLKCQSLSAYLRKI